MAAPKSNLAVSLCMWGHASGACSGKRWRQLGESLDRMRQVVDGPTAVTGDPDATEKRSGWTIFK